MLFKLSQGFFKSVSAIPSKGHHLKAVPQSILRAQSSSSRLLFPDVFTPPKGSTTAPNLNNPILVAKLMALDLQREIKETEDKLARLKLKWNLSQKTGQSGYKSYDAISNELLYKLSEAITKVKASFKMTLSYEESEVIGFLSPVLKKFGISFSIKEVFGESNSNVFTVFIPRPITPPLYMPSILTTNPVHMNLLATFAKQLEQTVNTAQENSPEENCSSPMNWY